MRDTIRRPKCAAALTESSLSMLALPDAYFIRDTSVAFDHAASSDHASSGLPIALEILCDLFQKMAVPLAVKSVILYGKWAAYWVRLLLAFIR